MCATHTHIHTSGEREGERNCGSKRNGAYHDQTLIYQETDQIMSEDLGGTGHLLQNNIQGPYGF